MSAPAPASTQQKLYRTLHDQIDLALYPQALRTVNKRKSTHRAHAPSTLY